MYVVDIVLDNYNEPQGNFSVLLMSSSPVNNNQRRPTWFT